MAEANTATDILVEPQQKDFSQRIKERLVKAFAEVLPENTPQIDVESFFAYHKTSEDSTGLAERIRLADLYVPEANEWTSEYLALLREASSGVKSPEDLMKGFKNGHPENLKEVYGSHTPVTIIDVPARHKLKKESDKVSKYDPSYEGDFVGVLTYTKEYVNSIASYQNVREEYMLNQITARKVEELLQTYPELGNKRSIKILFSIGIGHSAMPHDYPESPFTDQGIIICKRSGIEKVDDDLAAKIFLENAFEYLFNNSIVRLTRNSREIYAAKRIIFSHFDIKDAEKAFEEFRGNKGLTPPVPLGLFDEMLEEKGITIPDTREELDEFLARRPSRPASLSTSQT